MSRNHVDPSSSPKTSSPSLSVVVPTRNRPADVAACVETVLASEYGDLDLVVVDQSDTDATETALAPWRGDPRLRLLRTRARGASRARNAGIESARAPLVAFTDDDCRVPREWTRSIVEAFASRPDVGAMFGAVRVPPELSARGFAAYFEPDESEYHHRYPTPGTAWGLSANMAVRRTVLDDVKGFDPSLGAGARFPSAEEMDLTIRMIARGHKVLETAAFTVDHLGLRQGKDLTRLYRGYAHGIGAAYAKHLRLRTRGSVHLFAESLRVQAAHVARTSLRDGHPHGVGFLVFLLWGALRSTAQRIDADTQMYVDG